MLAEQSIMLLAYGIAIDGLKLPPRPTSPCPTTACSIRRWRQASCDRRIGHEPARGIGPTYAPTKPSAKWHPVVDLLDKSGCAIGLPLPLGGERNRSLLEADSTASSPLENCEGHESLNMRVYGQGLAPHVVELHPHHSPGGRGPKNILFEGAPGKPCWIFDQGTLSLC